MEEITLETNIYLDKKISNGTLNKIGKIIEIAKIEKKAFQELEITSDNIVKCYELLYNKINVQKTTAKELLEITGDKSLSLLIIKLTKFIKSRGDIWILKKGKMNDETVYWLEVRL
jgi:predicted CopG family antitoxin